MHKNLLFDIETNGLLPTVSVLHSLVIQDLDTNELLSYANSPDHPPLAHGLALLAQAETVIGHNIINYDLPVLRKLYPSVHITATPRDTLILARLMVPRESLIGADTQRIRAKQLPGRLLGSHSLEAFGYRMGLMKGEYSDWCKEQGLDPWSVWRPEMQTYCEQDVNVTAALYQRLMWRKYNETAITIENRVAVLCNEMTAHGFPFDEAAGAKLYAKIAQERNALEQELTTLFPAWYAPRMKDIHEEADTNGQRRKTARVVVPKKTTNYKARPGIVEGAAFTPIELRQFNPASREDIADRLRRKYGWNPSEFTDNGSPIVDEEVLSSLDFVEAKSLSRYLLLTKRAGQLAEGKEGWLRVTTPEGRIHHSVNTLGAVTRRATHSRPNIAQVPRVGSWFGAECRALFHPGTLQRCPAVQVGADLSGIELRMLAHYMSRWDGGEYAKAVVEGKESAGTDVHSVNCRALGLDPQTIYTINGKSVKGRDVAKTFIYAFLYGAGAAKIATILGRNEDEGAAIKKKFLSGLPALSHLIEAVQAKARKEQSVASLDGGVIPVRSPHSALNTLLQSAGAVCAKWWMVAAREAYDAEGWVFGTHYAWLAWIHDEIQAAVLPELVNRYEELTLTAIETTGQRLELRVPLSGTAKHGRNWAECH